MRFGFLLLATVLASCIAWHPTEAAITPSSVSLSVEPGTSVQQIIGVMNDTAQEQAYELVLSGVAFGDFAEDLRFVPLAQEYRSMITLDTQNFLLDSGAHRDIRLTVVSQANDIPQEFAFAVIAQTPASASPGVEVASAYASIFFVSLGESVAPTLQIQAFETIPHPDRALPIRFAGLVTNTGPSVSRPEIGVVIRNPWGKEIEHFSLNDLGQRIPVETSRAFTGEWTGYPWRLGPYTAEFYVYPDDSDTVLTAAIRVVLFPWQMLVVLAIIATLLSGGIYVLRRALRH
jgi:hypothetical protein